jgi:Domain of unknown function (DUF6431)
MQILHSFTGSVQHYLAQLSTNTPDRHRLSHCPQCQAKDPLQAHGFYTRTLLDTGFDGAIRIRRYLCQACRRTVSLLPDFALPYLRSSIAVIALFLVARLVHGKTLQAALPPSSPYQRGQFWLRRFRAQAESLCATLAAIAKPASAPHFAHRALVMLESAGWIPAHRFLFGNLRQHILGWPPSLAPAGRFITLASTVSSG